MRIETVAISACLCCFAVAVCGDASAAIKITVTAPDHDCSDLPMNASLPDDFEGDNFQLAKPDGSKTPAQIVRMGDNVLLLWILDELGAGEKLTYTLEPGETKDEGVEITKTDYGAEVKVDGELLTKYRKMSGHKPIYYPIYGPGGKAMTRNYPMKKIKGENHDHSHHRSFWFTHGNVNGVDFWSERSSAGKIIQKNLRCGGGPVAGAIITRNDWMASEDKRICSDRRMIAFHNVKNGKLFDAYITVIATDGPVTFGDTKEGSFGFRTATTMKPDAGKGGVVINSNGEKNKKAWGKRAKWVDMYGPVDGDVVGIAMLEHPESFRSPTYWHARTYGLVAANPFGLHHFLRDKKQDGSHRIEQGGSITFRFRIWLHEGSAEEADVEAKWQQYAHPPTVEVTQ